MTWADRRNGLEQIAKRAKADPPHRILINLVGPPGAGKSTLAAAYCRRHPDWTFLSIDQYMLSGLTHREAWEALRQHARIYPRAIVESSGLSRYLRPLLTRRNHCTIIVTSREAKERRESRVKEVVPLQAAWGTHDDLEAATARLPRAYPEALVLEADGDWTEVLPAFEALMAVAARRATAGAEGEPTSALERPKRPAKRREGDPVKRKAQKSVYHALRRGDLVRQPCEVCGKGPAQAHHEDYGRPLDVRWLCRVCHERADKVREQRVRKAARRSPSPGAAAGRPSRR